MHGSASLRRWYRGLRWAGVSASLLAVVGYLAISIFAASVLTRPNNRANALDPRVVSGDAERWSVRTSDGVTLRGWYYPSEQSRRLVVLVHGMKESWDSMAGLGHDLHARGYDVLLFDLRGHGQSDTHRLTMGRGEQSDLRAALAWAQAAGFSPDRIGWIGQSMGASTVLMEAAENPEIRVAVLDSPYGNLPELLDRQLAQHSHLPRAFNPGIVLAAHQVYGIRTDDLVPIESARRWGARPMLLIHGELDEIVPVRQARELARAAGRSCEAHFLSGVGHVDAYRARHDWYMDRVDRFLDTHLKP